MKIWNDLHESFQLDKDGYFVLNVGHNEIPDSHWEQAKRENAQIKQELSNLNLLPYEDMQEVSEWMQYKSDAKIFEARCKMQIGTFKDIHKEILEYFSNEDNRKDTYTVTAGAIKKSISESFEKLKAFNDKHQDNERCVADMKIWQPLYAETIAVLDKAIAEIGEKDVTYTYEMVKDEIEALVAQKASENK